MWLCWPEGGQCGQSETTPLTLLMETFSVSVFQGGVSPLSPSYEIFTMVTCLWIVASLSLCEGD